ncbi:hypothetical protein [Bacteroides graminisolvens]|jgi:hypothetical protein|uniref:hypothetical protein n=1 Tax=Bacteroides graminisolvens TaxID=477666 RepID=UPI0023F28A0D|nr:hypothetical protein [Bacteroides graminisolvens]
MKQTFDTDSILYQILNGSPAILSAISGGVYIDERPDGSEAEDIVVNTIDLTQDNPPQLGTSNVNIHVSDKNVQINGIQQKKKDRERLKSLTTIVLDVLKSAKVEGLSLVTAAQTTIKEPTINQHYVNIRVDWVIH